MNVGDEYCAALVAALAQGPPPELDAAAALLHDAITSGNTTYTFGNGACASLASHIAADLGKGLGGVHDVSLVDNAPLVTAYANDHDYECVFERQLRSFLRDGDIALGLSGSGASPNVLLALEYARSAGGRTIALTGYRSAPSRLESCCDVVVRAPLRVIDQIEDLHVVFAHILVRLLRERLHA